MTKPIPIAELRRIREQSDAGQKAKAAASFFTGNPTKKKDIPKSAATGKSALEAQIAAKKRPKS